MEGGLSIVLAEPVDSPVQPYGTNAEGGDFECVDCGEAYRHASTAPLPPCPRYRDLTHPLAAWRVAVDRPHRDDPGSADR